MNYIKYTFPLIFIVILSNFYFLYNKNYFISKLSWDEVDYLNATEKGYFHNSFEFDSLNLIEFAQLGYYKYKKNNKKINYLASKFPNENSDTFLLRHFHPPLPIYYFSILLNFFDNDFEKNFKNMNYVFSIIFLLIFSFCVLMIDRRNFLFKLIILSFFFISDYYNNAFIKINFHTFHSLSIIVFFYFIHYFYNNENKYKYVYLALSINLVLLTLETSILILFSTLILLWLFNKREIFILKNLFKLFVLIFLFLIVLWPSVFITGGTLKSWLMYAYRIFLMQNEEYQNVVFFDTIINIFITNKVFFIIVIFLFINFIYKIKSNNPILSTIPTISGIFYLLFLSPFVLSNVHLFPAISLILFGLLNTISDNTALKNNKFNLIIFLVFMFIYSNNIFSIYKSKHPYYDYTREIIDYINFNISDNSELLIDGGHIYRFYTKNNNIDNLYFGSYSNPQLYIRNNYQYVNVINNNYLSKYKIIIIKKSRNISKKLMDEIENESF